MLFARNAEGSRYPWLELALACSLAALFFQLFPGVWSRVVSFMAIILGYGDVRGWTWRMYATACGIAIAMLVVVKLRHDNS